jgi:SulP family sulfate permease
VDVAGAEFLAQEARMRRQDGGGLYLYNVKQGACEPLRRGRYVTDIGQEDVFETKEVAIRGVFERLDREVCRHCDKRIFLECATVDRGD